MKRLAMILAFLACSCAWAQVDDAYTTSLLHFDGDFTDEAGLTWTGFANAVATSTDSKFGGSSLYLDGASWLAASSSAGLDFGAGSFTVDWWERRTTSSPGGTVFARDGGIQYSPVLCGYEYLGNVVFWATTAGSWDISGGEVMGAASTSWVHRAVVRDGSTFYLFENGAQTTTFSSAGTIAASTADAAIGVYFASNYFIGYIDEFRVSKGVARWTSAFTPPTAAYGPATPTVATPAMMVLASDKYGYDSNTLSLLHMDGSVSCEILGVGAWSPSYAAQATSTAKFGQAMAFNGMTSELSYAPLAFGTGDFTVEGWFYVIEDTPRGSNRDGLISLDRSSNGFNIAVSNATDVILISYMTGSTHNEIMSAPHPIRTYFHLALVRESGDLRLYRDGVKVAAASNSYDFVSGDVAIGAGIFTGTTVSNIDEVRFSNVARYKGDSFSVQTSAFEPTERLLNLLLPFAAGGRLTFGGAP